MAVINTGRFNRGLQKALGVKGEIVVPDLDSAVQASFELNHTNETDLRWLFGWRSFATAFNQGAGGANFTVVSIRNPANSNVVLVVERWHAHSSEVAVAEIGLYAGTGAVGGGNGVARDTRQSSARAASTGLVTASNPAAQPGGTRMSFPSPVAYVAATVISWDVIRGERDELVVMPGDDYALVSEISNVSIRGGIWWRERALDPSELTA